MMHVYAIGSPFNDDNISWRLLDSIKHALNKFDYIEIHYLDRPGVQLVNELQNKSDVILLDALLSNSEPGNIHDVDWRDLAADSSNFSSHDFSVSHALQLAHQLGSLPAKLQVLAINIHPQQCLNEQQFTLASSQLLQRITSMSGL